MQLVDPEDPRPRHDQIAASIRAAILTGELEPGAQLLTSRELAQFFGVARGTVQSAVRRLTDEGYVRAVTGSGIYVRDRATLPVPDGQRHELAGAANFLYEMGRLKNLPRTGWQLLGIPLPESVAEHSFRVAMVALVLAAIEGADVGRTVALAAFHDGHETRIGDVPSVGRAYVSTAAPEALTAHQVAGMPESAAKVLMGLTAEYEANETIEARLAHDADKLETLLQASEYQAQGYETAGWRETSLSAQRTDAGKQLAQAIGAASPYDWFAPFQSSYHELRTATRAAHSRSHRGPTAAAAAAAPVNDAGRTAQPVVAAIVTSESGVLVGRRNDGTPPWTFIAGEMEPGEQPEDTAVREVKEETGLEVETGAVIGVRVHPATGRTMIYMAARPVHGTGVFVGDETELAEVRWIGVAEADKLLPDMFEPVREHLALALADPPPS